MNREEYIDSFKNPKWQKKRLHILSRDNFTCQMCGEKYQPLHVHHRYYNKDCKPWEYPDDALVTLCERCHDVEHYCDKNSDENYFSLKKFFKRACFSMLYFNEIIMRLGCIEYPDCSVLDTVLRNYYKESLSLDRDKELFDKIYPQK